MRNLNFLRKSERKSVGTTLALTVGSPSAHRRYSALKHLAFMLLFLLGSLNVWGEDETWSWTLATGNNLGTANSVTTNPSGSKTLTGKVGSDDVAKSWDFAMVSGTSKYYLNGAQIGSGTNYCTSVTLSTSAFTQTIKNVKVTSKCGSSATATISISVGGTTYVNAQSLSTTETVYGLASNTGTATGDIVITLSQPSTHKALYIYKVDVIYEAGGASLESIEITGTPEATSYEQGQSFDPKGLTVTAHYDDATNADVTDDVEWSFDPASFSVVGTNKSVTATATYNDKEDTKIIDNITVTEHVVTAGTYDITFNNAFFGTTGLTGSLSGADLKDYAGAQNDITIEYQKGTGGNMYLKDSEIRLYKGNGLVVTAPAGYNITSITGLKTTLNASTGTMSGTVWSGEANSVSFSHANSTGNSALTTITVTYEEAGANPKAAKPTFETGDESFLTSTSVTLACETTGAIIYYTTDGNEPTTSSSVYSAAIPVSATTTIKAIAVADGYDNSAVAEKTFTKITPLTVAEALAEATGSGKYVTGTITSITEVNTGYKNATYVISDISAGVPQNEMIVYRGKYIGGADFTSSDQIHVGDVVVVSGSIAVHAEKNQMAQGNQIETISAPAVAAPVFDPNGGGFVVSTDVTITCATGSSTIYYTLDETNPSKSSSVYSSPIHLDATKTIKAIAYVGDESSLVVEKTFTLTDPKTVAEAYDELVSADLENVAVEGIVYNLSISSGNATYWISDDGNAGTKVLEVFKGKGIGGADVAAGDIREGDKVIVFGTLTIYTGGSEDVKEFIAGSRLLSLTRKTVESVAVTGTPSKTNYKVGDAFDPAGLTVTVTYDDASHATVAVADCSWEKNPATFDAAGTGLSVNVKATYDGVQSPAFAVEGITVKVVPTFDDPNHEWQLVTSNAQLVAGKYYVIGSAAQGKVAGAISNDILGTVDATIADGAIAYNAFGTDQTADAASAVVFELGGTTGAWTLNEAIDELGQLAYKGNKTVKWETESTAAWAITIADNNATLVPAAANSYHILYNTSYPRFTVYNSAPQTNMPLPQLYVWALKTYKLRYDANGGEDAPAAQPAVAGQATVTDAEPTYTDHIFNGWNTLVGGDGEAKAAGDVIDLSAGDVTLYAQWRTPKNDVTVSYDANGGEGTMVADENQVEGSQYTIKANEFTREGYNFTGWKAYDANDAELAITNGKFIVPATNVTVKAQWGAWMATEFVLVTDKAQLKDGDKVYIVAAESEYERAMGTQNGTSYRNEVAIKKAGSSIKVMEGAEPVEFTLGKSGDNFTFRDETGYLYAAGTATSKANYMNTKTDYDEACDWTITIDESGTEIKSVANDKTPFMQYNHGSTRFSCYNTASLQAVVLYKKADYTRAATEGRYGTICLPQAGQIIGATLYEVADKDDSKIYFDEILNGQMEAGKPYIFLPNSGESQLAVLYTSDEEKSVQPANGLVGFIGANADAEKEVPVGMYILNNNQYRLVEHAGSAKIKSYRSYIDLDAISSSMPAPGRRRISMSYFGSQVATGIENAEANEAPRKVLINGEFFIIRGEKVYDAKGQLVK